ncbi:LysR family transcriptional regulator [Klebsiella aerogenes]|nr:LysR family transcriptional regulator [Klebsiella aerogenes]
MLHERPMSYLYEVGIQGGIRRAADILGINPSVISRQIAQLERTLELPLLERQGRNVALTEAGRLLAEDYHESRQRREKAGESSKGFTPYAWRHHLCENWRGVGDDLYRVGDEHVFAVVAERIR